MWVRVESRLWGEGSVMGLLELDRWDHRQGGAEAAVVVPIAIASPTVPINTASEPPVMKVPG